MSAFAGRSGIPGAPGASITGAAPPPSLFTGGIPHPGAPSAQAGIATGGIIRDGNNRTNQYTQVNRVVDIKAPSGTPSSGKTFDIGHWSTKPFAARQGELVFIMRGDVRSIQTGAPMRAAGPLGKLGKGYERVVRMMTLETFEEMTQDPNSTCTWKGAELRIQSQVDGTVLFTVGRADDANGRVNGNSPFLVPSEGGMTTRKEMYENWEMMVAGTNDVPAENFRKQFYKPQDMGMTDRTGPEKYDVNEMQRIASHGSHVDMPPTFMKGRVPKARFTTIELEKRVHGIPSVDAQRQMRRLAYGKAGDGGADEGVGILSTLFGPGTPDGIVLGKYGTGERWDVDDTSASLTANDDMYFDAHVGALYNIIVEGFGVCTSFWRQGSTVFRSPQQYSLMPRDRLYLLVIANDVTDGGGTHLLLKDFKMVRASSSDLFRMSGLYGAADGGRSPADPSISPLNAVFREAAGMEFHNNARVLGAWQIGSVTDNAAAETSFAFNSTSGAKNKRLRASFMSMQLNVNIKWVTAYEMHKKYWTNVGPSKLDSHRNQRIAGFHPHYSTDAYAQSVQAEKVAKAAFDKHNTVVAAEKSADDAEKLAAAKLAAAEAELTAAATAPAAERAAKQKVRDEARTASTAATAAHGAAENNMKTIAGTDLGTREAKRNQLELAYQNATRKREAIKW